MNNQQLLDKLDRTAEMLSNTLIQLTRSSDLDEETTSGSESSNSAGLATVSTSGIQMTNTYTMQLIKGVQDLLVLTRTIREKWVLNQMPDQGNSASQMSAENLQEYKDLIENSMNAILKDMR